jgi:UDP-N-acetylmuramoylalanine--D-glutamate ligase
VATIPLTVGAIADAVSGRLVSGDRATVVDGVSIDTRRLKAGELYVAIRGERYDGHDFVAAAFEAGACGAIVSRPIGELPGALAAGRAVIVVPDGTGALQRLARWVRRASGARVVAITGSAGKTTTKDVAAAFLGLRHRVMQTVGNLNNHIGLPLSLLELRHGADVAVVELGMNHAGEISRLVAISEPDVRVWTNVADVHLEFFASVDAIADAKAEVMEGATPDSVLVANADDPRVTTRVVRFPGRVITFGSAEGASVRASAIEERGIDGMAADVRTGAGRVRLEVPLLGRGNLQNVVAAVAIAAHFGVPLEAMADRAPTIRAASHRGDVLRLDRGVVLVDDTYNSNPRALQGALAVIAAEQRLGRRVAVVGEMLELGAASVPLHEACGRAAAESGLSLLITVGGEAARALGRAAVEAGMPGAAVRHADSSADAADMAAALVQPRDLVLVKGSRGIGTEAVVDRLEARFGRAERRSADPRRAPGTTRMPELQVEGKRVVVVGAARSGLAAAALLARRGAHVTLADLKPALPDAHALAAEGVALALGPHDPRLFSAADLIVLSPGVPPRQPVLTRARRAKVPIVGEIELASRMLRGRIIAITGTKGKSTTTTLVGRILSAAGLPASVAGNIGDPLSAKVEVSTDDTIHVVEVSSFQLETTQTCRPWIAALLNLSVDHLDRHASVREYAAAKARIFANQSASDFVVVNADDPPAMRLAARKARAPRHLFALDRPLSEGTVLADGWIVSRAPGRADRPVLPVTDVQLIGRHLLSDVAAATTIALLAGASPEAIRAAVAGFGGLEHALERVGVVGRITFVNDSKATNIESARRAIESFEGRLVPIIGGRFKGGDFRDLRPALAGRSTAVVAIGEARPAVREALGDVVAVIESGSMEEAVRAAAGAAPPGGTVLLAPACASFDMFRDYAERGRAFKQEVARLAEEWNGTP